MFSRKKKSKTVIQGTPDIPIDETIDWTAQHHTKTQAIAKHFHHNQSSSHLHHQQQHHQQQQNHHLHHEPQQTTLQPPPAFSSMATRNGSMTMLSSSSNIEYPHSGDESDHITHIAELQRSHFYAADPQKRTKEYHVQQAIQAVELLKVAAKPTGWKKIDKHKSGCIVYQSTATDKHVAFKGEHVIHGFRAQDVFSVVGVRKLWDDWYDELSCIEAYDDSTSLMYMVMKGTMSSRTRDVALVERIQTERDGTIYFAACSVESDRIPPVPGKVRADIFIAGWIIQPLPSNPPITKITYVIQTDLLSRLPKFIAKRSLIKRALVITTIETHLKKNGTPVAMSKVPSRPRSLSEPLKLGGFEHMESDEEIVSDPILLSPFGTMESEDEIEDVIVSLRKPSGNVLQPKVRHSLAPSVVSSQSLFTAEFLESNLFLGDSAFFSDSPLFGKSGIFDAEKKTEEPSAKSTARSQPPSQTKAQPEPVRPEALRPQPPEQDPRSRQTQKRVSVPVVQPKSDARSKQYQLPSTAERPVQKKTIVTSTPPLTPTASLDGKDATSDSDMALTPELKPVPRASKPSPSSLPTPDTPSRPSSMAMSSFGMKAPSAMMEARRHSGMFNRGATSNFVPRHSHVVPIRGNPNVSLQSLTRPSGPNGTMTTAMKRHSTAPSIESNRSTTGFAPTLVLPHRHSETARKALAMFKVLASSSEDRWRTISSENGFKAYSRVISGAGLPMLRGEGTITGGWTVEQINAVIESSGCRQIWDDRFDNLSIAETFNHNEYLFHITLKGVGSLTGRDLAGVTIIDRDPQTSALYNVSTSVLDPTIPEDPGRIRAMLELSGWSLRPTFDGQGNTVSVNVTFVIQIDIRGTLPSSVVKSMTSSMTMAVSRLNQFINKTGYPPFASHISGTRLLDTFEPQTGFFELCYKAAPGWTEVRVGRKVYKEGYDFFIKPDDPTVRVELAPDFGGVRIWTTLDHEGQSIIAQVSRKGQYRVEPEYKEEKVEEKVEAKVEEKVEETIKEIKKAVEGVQVNVPVVKKVQEDDAELASPISRKHRNASSSSIATSYVSSARPDSQASVASKASQGSEKGGRRGRSRTIVALPAGTPPPPLPRRSSSLSRYSIPISPYVPEDAPPLPTNTTITAGILANAGIERTSSLATSPTTSTPAILVSSSRPVSDALASPTLGPFHIPHRPAAVPRISSEIRVDAPAAHMESINTVLAESLPASPSSVSELELEPTAVETKEPVVVAVAAAVAATTPVTLVVDTTSVVKDDKEDVNSSAAPSPIPSSPIKELVVATLANIASPAASPVPTQGSVFATMQSSRLKHSTSSVSVGGTRRVTFSLETIEISSDETNKDKTNVVSASPLDEIVRLKGVLKDTSATAASTPNAANIHTVKIVEVQTTESQSTDIFSSDAHYGVVEETQIQDYESDEAEFVEARDELSEEEAEMELVVPSDVFVKTEFEVLSVDMVLNSIIQAIEEVAGQLTATQIKFGVVFLLLIYYAGRLSPLIAYS
ncbi:hypothetical protein BGZ93_007223 [Podila epicladia]|nr:hypothetical protein BGZ93_007223 [Podila epicladia]